MLGGDWFLGGTFCSDSMSPWLLATFYFYVITEWEFAMVKIIRNYKPQIYSSSSMVLFISLLQSVIIARIIECHETHFPRPTAERLRHDSDVWCEGAEESTLLCMLDTHVQTKVYERWNWHRFFMKMLSKNLMFVDFYTRIRYFIRIQFNRE